MKLLLNYALLLTLFACAHNYTPVPEVVVTDPETLPVEVEKPSEPGIILDAETLKDPVFILHKGLTKETLAWLEPVARAANCVVLNEEFLKEVSLYPRYTSTKLTPAQVVEEMRKYPQAELSTYWPKWRFSKVIAYRSPGSNIVYYNLRRNPTELKDQVATAIHEWVHVVGFDHSSASDWESAPYMIGTIAEKYAAQCGKE